MDKHIEKFKENWPWIVSISFVLVVIGWGFIDWLYNQRLENIKAEVDAKNRIIAKLETNVSAPKTEECDPAHDKQLAECTSQLKAERHVIESLRGRLIQQDQKRRRSPDLAPLREKLQALIEQAKSETILTPKGNIVGAYNAMLAEARELLPNDPYIKNLQEIREEFWFYESKKKVIQYSELLLRHLEAGMPRTKQKKMEPDIGGDDF